ncbi:MAG: glucose-1-phosphate cytidylyltransferase [Geminicoccaceae bacterium]|nr:glucose-1-phosphate cytidylyltransferase [Geminicoccaceae bacterium]
MKVGILAGGLGSRLSEETTVKPKPMVEIGGVPILWHIMMHYSFYGHKDFVIALGYKGEYIKKYMADYCSLNSNLTVDMRRGKIEQHAGTTLDWRVDLVDTGQQTQTGGRIKRLKPYMGDGTFMLTWGDGVSTIDLDALLAFHKRHGKLATVSAVRPPARFGRLDIQGDEVVSFEEKPQMSEGWINGAFFVLEPGIFDYIDNDMTHFEREPLEHLAQEGQLMAYRHDGFWQCMDTVRDKVRLEEMWDASKAPWKLWD